MKKVMTAVLALVLMLGVMGCGGNAKVETAPVAPAAEAAPAAPAAEAAPAAPAAEAAPAAPAK